MNFIKLYPDSFFLYIFIIIFVTIIAKIATIKNKKNNKRSNIYVLFIIIILSIFAGIRGENVGIDVAHYIKLHIEPISRGMFWNVNQPIGFKTIVLITYIITNNTWIVFLIFSMITNFCIIKRLWDFREKASFTMMTFIYCCAYYLITFNVFRQFISIGIVFFGTRLLEKRKYLKYTLVCLLAMTIHETALLGLIMVPFSILFLENNNNIKRIFLIVLPFIIILATIFLYNYFDFDHYINLYNRYSNGSLGIMTPIKILLLVVFSFILFMEFKENKPLLNVEKNEYKYITYTYLFGLLISLLVVLSQFADRFGWYFMMWEPVYMSLNIKSKKTRLLFRTIYILITLYTIFVSLNNSGQGIMPYTTIWNNY